ncbi:MAG: DUF998 domain-containing protein [Rhodoglobus sp.]
MSDRAYRQWVLVLFAVAAILYCGLPLEAAMGFPLNPADSYQSELAARDQPFGLVFRLGDALAASLVLVGSFFILKRTALRGLARASVIGLVVFGVGTIADTTFSMECASSASSVCARADALGQLDLPHQIHTVTSVVALAGVIVSLLLIAILILRAPPGARPRGSAITLTGAAVIVVASAAISAAALWGSPTGSLAEGFGYVQRFQTLMISAYILSAPYLISQFSSRRETQS